jgi:Protein of unknown function (DUF3224)
LRKQTFPVQPGTVFVVVPDSGPDQLAGISGKFSIEIKAGQHF